MLDADDEMSDGYPGIATFVLNFESTIHTLL